eukprot:1160883-Pelagomonas_calceolata.AAC.15
MGRSAVPMSMHSFCASQSRGQSSHCSSTVGLSSMFEPSESGRRYWTIAGHRKWRTDAGACHRRGHSTVKGIRPTTNSREKRVGTTEVGGSKGYKTAAAAAAPRSTSTQQGWQEACASIAAAQHSVHAMRTLCCVLHSCKESGVLPQASTLSPPPPPLPPKAATIVQTPPPSSPSPGPAPSYVVDAHEPPSSVAAATPPPLQPSPPYPQPQSPTPRRNAGPHPPTSAGTSSLFGRRDSIRLQLQSLEGKVAACLKQAAAAAAAAADMGSTLCICGGVGSASQCCLAPAALVGLAEVGVVGMPYTNTCREQTCAVDCKPVPCNPARAAHQCLCSQVFSKLQAATWCRLRGVLAVCPSLFGRFGRAVSSMECMHACRGQPLLSGASPLEGLAEYCAPCSRPCCLAQPLERNWRRCIIDGMQVCCLSHSRISLSVAWCIYLTKGTKGTGRLLPTEHRGDAYSYAPGQVKGDVVTLTVMH